MGSQSSKPVYASNSTTTSADNPVRFSEPLINSLENSTETDSTRAKALELEIQRRVNAELQHLRSIAAKEYSDLQAKISIEDEVPGNKSGEQNTQSKSPNSVEAGDRLRQLGREAVLGDIQELKSKLEKSKRIRALDDEVEKAKKQVINCLTENDRRPLDCWASVERFKEEVARLEEDWIQKVVS